MDSKCEFCEDGVTGFISSVRCTRCGGSGFAPESPAEGVIDHSNLAGLEDPEVEHYESVGLVGDTTSWSAGDAEQCQGRIDRDGMAPEHIDDRPLHEKRHNWWCNAEQAESRNDVEGCAKSYNVPVETVRRWRKEYIKSHAIKAAMTPTEIAAKLGLDPHIPREHGRGMGKSMAMMLEVLALMSAGNEGQTVAIVGRVMAHGQELKRQILEYAGTLGIEFEERNLVVSDYRNSTQWEKMGARRFIDHSAWEEIL